MKNISLSAEEQKEMIKTIRNSLDSLFFNPKYEYFGRPYIFPYQDREDSIGDEEYDNYKSNKNYFDQSTLYTYIAIYKTDEDGYNTGLTSLLYLKEFHKTAFQGVLWPLSKIFHDIPFTIYCVQRNTEPFSVFDRPIRDPNQFSIGNSTESESPSEYTLRKEIVFVSNRANVLYSRERDGGDYYPGTIEPVHCTQVLAFFRNCKIKNLPIFIADFIIKTLRDLPEDIEDVANIIGCSYQIYKTKGITRNDTPEERDDREAFNFLLDLDGELGIPWVTKEKNKENCELFAKKLLKLKSEFDFTKNMFSEE